MVLPGGSSPRPPFSRFARRAVTDWYIFLTALTELPAPSDLFVCHRTSWGILPQTPVLSLRSACCRWNTSITVSAEHPGPKDLDVNHRTSWGILPQTSRALIPMYIYYLPKYHFANASSSGYAFVLFSRKANSVGIASTLGDHQSITAQNGCLVLLPSSGPFPFFSFLIVFLQVR
jgi:hypothetical protein